MCFYFLKLELSFLYLWKGQGADAGVEHGSVVFGSFCHLVDDESELAFDVFQFSAQVGSKNIVVLQGSDLVKKSFVNDVVEIRGHGLWRQQPWGTDIDSESSGYFSS